MPGLDRIITRRSSLRTTSRSASDTLTTMLKNLGRADRSIRIVLGVAVGVSGIFISGNPWLGRALGVAGAVIILGGICGT